MVCESKKDWILYVFPIVMEPVIILSNIYKGSLQGESIILFILFSSMLLLFIFINMLTIKYVFTETELVIKTCLFKIVIKLNKVTCVRRTWGIYSFSASSCEQLKLTYVNGKIISISPKDLFVVEEYIHSCISKNIE